MQVFLRKQGRFQYMLLTSSKQWCELEISGRSDGEDARWEHKVGSMAGKKGERKCLVNTVYEEHGNGGFVC